MKAQFVNKMAACVLVWGIASCASAPSGPPADPNGPLGSPSGPPGATNGPLVCTPTSPCPPLQQEIEAQCKGQATVQTGMLGGLTVLKIETDPSSYVFTSFSYYYDASGRLVGRSMFVSEYARHSREGTVPNGAPLGMVDACPAKT